MPPKCRVLSETRGVMERADTDEIVARLRREDRPIRFFRSIDMLAAPDRSAIAKTVYAMPEPGSRRQDPGFQLERAYAASSGAEVKMGPPLWSRMPTGLGQYGAAIPLAAPAGPGRCWLEVRFRVRTGTVVFAFREQGKDMFLHQSMEVSSSEDVRDLYLDVPTCAGAEELVLRGYDAVEPTEVEIYELGLWVGQRR